MSAEVTPAVERAESAIYSTIWGGPRDDDRLPDEEEYEGARTVLAAALNVAEMAVALFAYEYPGRFWGDAPSWMKVVYVERAQAVRAHLLGTTP